MMTPSRQAISPLSGTLAVEGERQYYLLYEEIQILLIRLTQPVGYINTPAEDEFEHPMPSAKDPPGTGLWYLYESPVLKEASLEDEWTVLTVSRYGRGKQTGRTTKLVSIGQLMGSDESSMESMWLEGSSKLDQYLKVIRTQPEQQEEPIYGIVTIGHLSRFYEVRTFTSRWRGVPGADKTFHLAEDEEDVHILLNKWAQESRQGAVLLT